MGRNVRAEESRAEESRAEMGLGRGVPEQFRPVTGRFDCGSFRPLVVSAWVVSA